MYEKPHLGERGSAVDEVINLLIHISMLHTPLQIIHSMIKLSPLPTNNRGIFHWGVMFIVIFLNTTIPSILLNTKGRDLLGTSLRILVTAFSGFCLFFN